jgi:hypothetical protein
MRFTLAILTGSGKARFAVDSEAGSVEALAAHNQGCR